MPAIVIIPARYSSSRFPGKPLCLLSDKPLIRHVYERAKSAKLVEEVFVATDDRRIYDAVAGFGGNAIMTSGEHQSGTDRIAEAVLQLQSSADIIVNVQGDEPMIEPEMVDDVIRLLLEDKNASIGTLARKLEAPEDINDPNVVKVVFSADGNALYFSRAPIPYHRDSYESGVLSPELKDKEKLLYKSENSSLITHDLRRFYYKHIGIYAYRKDVLLKFSKLPQTKLEDIEKLEQLRALENGFRIKVKETVFETIGVDTPADLERVRKWLSLSL